MQGFVGVTNHIWPHKPRNQVHLYRKPEAWCLSPIQSLNPSPCCMSFTAVCPMSYNIQSFLDDVDNLTCKDNSTTSSDLNHAFPPENSISYTGNYQSQVHWKENSFDSWQATASLHGSSAQLAYAGQKGAYYPPATYQNSSNLAKSYLLHQHWAPSAFLEQTPRSMEDGAQTPCPPNDDGPQTHRTALALARHRTRSGVKTLLRAILRCYWRF